MKLKLYKIKDKYAFCVDNFSSIRHSFLTSSCSNEYQYAWEAYRDANNLGLKQSYHIEAINKIATETEDLMKPVTVDASAEEMISEHYNSIYRLLSKKVEGMDKDEKDKAEIYYQEIKTIVEEILKIKDKIKEESTKKSLDDVISNFRHLTLKHFSMQLKKDIEENSQEQSSQEIPQESPQVKPESNPPVNAKSNKTNRFSELNGEIQKEIMESYGQQACKAIEEKHNGAIYKIDYANRTILIIESENKNPIIKIAINKSLNVDKIIPCGSVAEIFPISSVEFYQRYWKPIVESIGHFYIKKFSSILNSSEIYLPDISNSQTKYNLKGWNTINKNTCDLSLNFKGAKNNMYWDIEMNSPIKTSKTSKTSNLNSLPDSKYTEEDFIKGSPKLVQCIDPNLKSVYLKTGEVVQVIPLETHVEIDVNFGRAIMRLTGEQVKIINDLQNNP